MPLLYPPEEIPPSEDEKVDLWMPLGSKGKVAHYRRAVGRHCQQNSQNDHRAKRLEERRACCLTVRPIEARSRSRVHCEDP